MPKAIKSGSKYRKHITTKIIESNDEEKKECELTMAPGLFELTRKIQSLQTSTRAVVYSMENIKAVENLVHEKLKVKMTVEKAKSLLASIGTKRISIEARKRMIAWEETFLLQIERDSELFQALVDLDSFKKMAILSNSAIYSKDIVKKKISPTLLFTPTSSIPFSSSHSIRKKKQTKKMR